MFIFLGINELHVDANLVACPLNSPFQDLRYAQLPADRWNAGLGASISFHRRAGFHLQRADQGQACEQLILYSVREEFDFACARAIDREWEDGN